jgi:predicted nucleic acid-binding protein
VLDWIAQQDELSLHISVITLGELHKGIERLALSQRRRQLHTWLDRLCSAFAGRILPIDEVTAIEWGRLLARNERQGNAVPAIDALLGATAIVHGLAVVTRNASHLARTGAAIVDPWES